MSTTTSKGSKAAFVSAAHKDRARVYHVFPMPLTPISGTVGDIRALCGARFNVTALDTRTSHLHGCFRCDQRKRASRSTP